MTDSISEKSIPVVHISWKNIEEAQLQVIREALRLRYKKDSKLVSEYVCYVKILRQSVNPEEYIKSTAIMLFPNEDAYNRKMGKYRKWFQNKKDLLASIENLYSLFYTISKEERPKTEEEISKTMEELFADETEV